MKSNKALILIDLQNDFLDERGILYGVIKEQIKETNLIQKINNLSNSARKNNVKVIHAPIAFSSDYKELGENPYGIAKVVKDSQAFKINSDGAKIYPQINISDSDLILPFKNSISVFKSTNLDQELKKNNIDTVFIVGLLTDACVLATVIEAYDFGYNVIVISNATCATSQKAQEATINNIFPLFSKILTDQEAINLFNNKA